MMRNTYAHQLQQLHEALTQMGGHCNQAVSLAVRAVTEGNQELAQRAIELDREVDRMEREIERLCLKLLLQQQPVATDLRKISAALKLISDLERIGDQASDIAELSRFIGGGNEVCFLHLGEMALRAVGMVEESVTAFNQGDLALARKVIREDDVVDEGFLRVKADLIAAIAADPVQGERYLDVLMAAKYLERIGDHATNVAEWVEYSILGKRSKNGVVME